MMQNDPQFKKILEMFVNDLKKKEVVLEESSYSKWLGAYFLIAGQLKDIDDNHVSVGYEMFVDFVCKFDAISKNGNVITANTIIDFRKIRESL